MVNNVHHWEEQTNSKKIKIKQIKIKQESVWLQVCQIRDRFLWQQCVMSNGIKLVPVKISGLTLADAGGLCMYGFTEVK